MQHDVVCDLISEFFSFKSKSLKKRFISKSQLKNDLNQSHKSHEMI